jgi:soluble lytic murein transglycosylase
VAGSLLMLAACQTSLASTRAAGTDQAADHPAQRAADQATDQATLRRAFMQALQRVRQPSTQAADPPALMAYALYDYLLAARLGRELQSAPGDDLDERIDVFLRSHAGQPVTQTLQVEWLTSLAERQRWDWFLPRTAHATDPLLLCDRLQGQLATGDTAGLAAEALARWRLPIRQPTACAAVFDWLASQGLLTSAQAESRTRAALAAGNARLALEDAAGVASAQAAPLLQWAQLLLAPAAALRELASQPTRMVEDDALEAGFNRLSVTDPAGAARLLPPLLARPGISPGLQGRLRRAAALGLAYDHEPAAVAAFVDLPIAVNDEQVLEWRVRAALWSGEYARALDWIGQMPASLGAQPRWRYWRARALAVSGDSAAATALLAELAGLRDYHGYLAADQLHLPYSLNDRPSADDATVQNALAAEPGVIRAHELFACGMYSEAMAEWAVTLSGAAAAQKIQAAHLAARWGWYAQSIATLGQVGDWDDVGLRYPRPYPSATAAASQLTQIPSDWILAVMRQESLFRSDAVSRADARGLMQLQSATAAAVARRWHLPRPGPQTLFDADAAVSLGAARLRELFDSYGGQLAMALAAYNAGPVPVERWRPKQATDADVWIENIPYGETRGYVEQVLENIVTFTVAGGAAPPALAALLPPVGPP